MRRLGKVLAGLAWLMMVAALGLWLIAPSASSAVAAAQACPIKAQRVAQCVIASPGAFGTVDVAAAGAHPGIPWAVSDPGGALMAYVNLYELASAGDGGQDPGGLVCSTYKFAAGIACLTPRGNLILQATGPGGPAGPPRVLTPAGVALIGAMLRAGLTARDLVFIAEWIHARGG